MRVALGQISSTKDLETNLKQVASAAERAAQQGAVVIIFPEAAMLAFGGRLHDDAAAGKRRWEEGLARVAAQHEITVVAGGFTPEENTDPQAPRVTNELRVVTPEGQQTVYTKIHLYDAFGFQESEGVAEGNEPVTVEIAGVTFGLTTCYDVRFPKLYAELSRAGAQVMVVAASWAGGEGKLAQWQLLTSARALDSNSFVVAVDQADPRASEFQSPDTDITGPYGVGFSRVVSPFGVTVAELGMEPEVEVVDLDLSLVEKAKESLPILKNAKLGY